MKRRFCDFCNAEVDYSNPYVVLDEETVFEGRRVVVRIDLREQKTTADVARPDTCQACQRAIVAQVLGLQVKESEHE